MALGFEVPLLFVQIGLTHDEEARGESPRLWLSAADGTAELDSAALGASSTLWSTSRCVCAG